MEGKLIILAAPSGSGKSTIIKYLMENEDLNLHFSISATSRAPRGTEKNGVEYFFMTPDEFRSHIDAGDFIEYEEVYTDKFYGTLKSQVDAQLAAGENVIFDVDVKGAMSIKKLYGKRALSMFIQPPSIEELLAKAEYELSFADKFDEVVVNDNLEIAEVEAESLIEDFLEE